MLQKIPVPGDGGYDYLFLDEAANRLYVSHGTEVAVLDAASGAIIGVVAGLAGVHGISVVPEIGKVETIRWKCGIPIALNAIAPYGQSERDQAHGAR